MQNTMLISAFKPREHDYDNNTGLRTTIAPEHQYMVKDMCPPRLTGVRYPLACMKANGYREFVLGGVYHHLIPAQTPETFLVIGGPELYVASKYLDVVSTEGDNTKEYKKMRALIHTGNPTVIKHMPLICWFTQVKRQS